MFCQKYDRGAARGALVSFYWMEKYSRLDIHSFNDTDFACVKKCYSVPSFLCTLRR